MTVRTSIVLLLLLSGSGTLAADERTAAVAGNISALNIDSSTALSVSGSFEYRFTRVVGLEIDATLAPDLKSPFPGGYTILGGYPGVVTGSGVAGSAAALTIFPGPTF